MERECKFPNRLKEVRKKNNLTQFEMAEFLGLSDSGYQNLEYGKTDLHAEYALKVCVRFGVDMMWLICSDNREEAWE